MKSTLLSKVGLDHGNEKLVNKNNEVLEKNHKFKHSLLLSPKSSGQPSSYVFISSCIQNDPISLQLMEPATPTESINDNYLTNNNQKFPYPPTIFYESSSVDDIYELSKKIQERKNVEKKMKKNRESGDR